MAEYTLFTDFVATEKENPPKRNLEDNNVARHLMYLHLKRVGFLISVVSCQRVGEGRGLREMI